MTPETLPDCKALPIGARFRSGISLKRGLHVWGAGIHIRIFSRDTSDLGALLIFWHSSHGGFEPNHPEGYVPVPEDHVTFINYFTLTTSMNSTTSQHLKINNWEYKIAKSTLSNINYFNQKKKNEKFIRKTMPWVQYFQIQLYFWKKKLYCSDKKPLHL